MANNSSISLKCFNIPFPGVLTIDDISILLTRLRQDQKMKKKRKKCLKNTSIMRIQKTEK